MKNNDDDDSIPKIRQNNYIIRKGKMSTFFGFWVLDCCVWKENITECV